MEPSLNTSVRDMRMHLETLGILEKDEEKPVWRFTADWRVVGIRPTRDNVAKLIAGYNAQKGYLKEDEVSVKGAAVVVLIDVTWHSGVVENVYPFEVEISYIASGEEK